MTILSTRITYPMLSKVFTLLATSLLCSHSWATQTEPLAKMEVFAELDGAVGGITFTSDERLIFSYHPFYQPNIKVAELLADGSTKPFLIRIGSNAMIRRAKRKNLTLALIGCWGCEPTIKTEFGY